MLLAALAFAQSGCGIVETRTIVVTATPPPPTPAVRQSLSPRSFALTSADVETNLQQIAGRFHSNRETAAAYGLDPRSLARRGRITSYETEFKGQGATGFLEVDDIVAAWKTPNGARWDYDRVVQSARRSDGSQRDIQPVAAQAVGDESIGFSFRTAKQATNLRDYVVVFRRGAYRVYLQAVAVTGTVGDEDVLQLAQTIDRRIPRTQ